MFDATREARSRALEGHGPTLIEAVTMRMHGHAAHDDMKYVPKELVEQWRARDPLDRQEKRLRARGVDVDSLRAEVTAEIDAAATEALAGPMPSAEARWAASSARARPSRWAMVTSMKRLCPRG